MYYIPTQLLQAIVDYLQTRPYKEVADIIIAISRLQPVPKAKEETEQKPKTEDKPKKK